MYLDWNYNCGFDTEDLIELLFVMLKTLHNHCCIYLLFHFQIFALIYPISIINTTSYYSSDITNRYYTFFHSPICLCRAVMKNV